MFRLLSSAFLFACLNGAFSLSSSAFAQSPSRVGQLPGTYEGIQQVSTSMLEQQRIPINGLPSSERNGVPGFIGVAFHGNLVLAANHHFTLDLNGFFEGTWEVHQDKDSGQRFLRLEGPGVSLDAVFDQQYGMGPQDVGIWKQQEGEYWLIQFRRVGDVHHAELNLTDYTESIVAEAFGNGAHGRRHVIVDPSVVMLGSGTGTRVAGDHFGSGTRFSSGVPGQSGRERILLTFLEDGRFNIQSMLAGVSQSGTYAISGTRLMLTLGGVEEVWELGRERMTETFAIRPEGADSWFVEISAE